MITVFTDLSLQVKKGETLAVLGPSGIGKSTLLSLISGLDSPDEGQIFVDGSEVTTMNEKRLGELRKKDLGIIFQKFNLFDHLTALENVALPLELSHDPEAMEKARQALHSVGLSDRLDHFPYQLSGGENQRVAIARALVIKPKLLLADEPSGSLDQKTGDEVMDLLFNLVKELNSTMVLVTHNEDLASRCHGKHLIRR